MKNKKLFTAALLLAIAAFLFTACPHNTLTTQQQKAYDDFINATFNNASNLPIAAANVAGLVSEHNERIASFGIKIFDTTPSQDIAKGTSKEALKARFIPVKI